MILSEWDIAREIKFAKGANVNFTVFEFPLMLFYKQMVRDNNCARL